MSGFRNCYAAAFLLIGTIALAQSPTAGIPWAPGIEEARATAKATGRPLLVHFWTPTCGPCKLLDANVFAIPQVGQAMGQMVVPVKVNAAEAQQLAEQYGVTRVPTDVLVSPEGAVIDRFVSPATPMDYVSKVTKAVGTYKTQAGAAYQAAASQSPYAGVVNDAYANLNVPKPQAPAAAPAAGDRYAAQVPGAAVNPYAAWQQGAGAPTATGPAAPVTQPVAPQQAPPAVVVNTAAQQQPQPTQPTAPQPTQSLAAQLPPGSPPLGFDGFCPVTMKRDWKWVQGDLQFGAIHRGRTYLFVTAADRDEFLRQPDTYSPAMSGMDPVLAIDNGQAVPGIRKHALEYGGSFYWFSSEETLNQFWNNAPRYSEGVRQAMTSGEGRMTR